MTGIKSLENGAKQLYDEKVTPRNSPAFSRIGAFGLEILRKILSNIGAWINEHTGWIAPYIGAYERAGSGHGTEIQKAPEIASGYKIAMAREAIPVSTYRNQRISQVYGRCAA